MYIRVIFLITSLYYYIIYKCEMERLEVTTLISFITFPATTICSIIIIIFLLLLCTCKSDCLGCAVLLCLVCLFDLACFFLSSLNSHLSYKNMYILGLVFGVIGGFITPAFSFILS